MNTPSDNSRPTIGITMGDPCGIGAEIIVKALADDALRARAKFMIFGFSDQLAYTADAMELPWLTTRDEHEHAAEHHEPVVVLDYDEITIPPSMPRGPSALGGRASLAFLDGAIDASRTGLVDAIVTGPISKTSWHLSGMKRFPGHTELLANRFNAKHVAMMFVAPQLRVVLATIHEPISQLRNLFTIGRVFNPIELADHALRNWFGCDRPRLAVCGLNPHAGEEGKFGDEEQRVITPAILMAEQAGILADGPFPADTVFTKALAGEYDCVVAMYHDQGLIPIKLLARDDAVNLTLGLPIIRTSPDHGTAFDIAGHGTANPGSMIAAIHLAIDLANKQHP
jgi:4-hydroxythreonine-4-phosphate dehydrogenase